MITRERIKEIEEILFSKHGYVMAPLHKKGCGAAHTNSKNEECDCGSKLVQELLRELKDSISREKKKREEVSRFAKSLTEWIEDQIKP